MQIAICDDERLEREHIQALLERYAPEISVVQFSSAEDLLYAAETDFFPLIFMDIEMELISGFEAAELLMSKKQKPLIVFVTKSTAYTVRGYDVAFHYLVKPIREDKFNQVLDRALRRLTPRYFSFLLDGSQYRVPLNDILYFESHNYMLRIHTENRVYETRLSLKDVETDLYGADFFRVHASYLINLQHVVRISKTEVELTSSEIVRISRSKKKDFDAALTEFMRQNI